MSPPTTRRWQPAETRLVAEYLAWRYRDYRCIQRVRVGQIRSEIDMSKLNDAERALVGVWRRWVDGVAIGPNEVVLVEGSIRPDLGHISQLRHYLRIWPATPEYADYVALPTRGELVMVVDDPTIAAEAADLGIQLKIFRPAWIEDYIRTLAPRAQIPLR